MRYLKYLLFAAVTAIAVITGSYFYFVHDLPTLTRIEEYNPNLVTKVYSNDGQVIAEFYLEKRVVVPLSKMPPFLIQAFLAAEDSKFYEHEGISFTSILRAFYKNVTAGKVVQGGSTITQQVAKSFFLSPERTLTRKVREALLAYRIEKHLTKEDILHLYLNQIYFGNGAYGIQTAAEAYFGKGVDSLDIAESALLAGLPKAPSRYSPFANFDLAKKRQRFILSRMVEEGFITEDMAARAMEKKLVLMPKTAESLWVGPYFTEHVRRYIEEKYGEDALYKGGLEVYTTLDVQMQRAANQAVKKGLRDYDKRRGFRGPIAVLSSTDEIEAFKAELDKKLQREPIKPNNIYQAVINGFNSKDNVIIASIGGKRGIITEPDFEWAKLYNPSGEPDAGQKTDIKKVLRPGHVVEVMVKENAENSVLLPLKLEQPPLAEASFLAIEPETGFVKAMIGGSDFSKTQFNRAVQAYRQPGSSFKPIIYTAALDNGYTPASIVVDSPLVFEEALTDSAWRPKNYDGKFRGPTILRDALAKSRNVITIKILKDIGVRPALEYAKNLGINAPLANDLSLALGSSAVTLLEMTGAFGTLANLGARAEPMFIKKIADRRGNVYEENTPRTTQAVSPQTAYIMTSLMQSVIQNGTARRARALGRPAAGKTGTTNSLNDAWFLGYVPGLVAGAWVGYDDERPLGRGETGAKAALPIWIDFMKEALAGTPVRDFPVPEGVEFAKIDPETGLLAGPDTTNPFFEVFKPGSIPTAVSTVPQKARSDDFLLMDSSMGANTGARKADEEVDELFDEEQMD